MCELLYNEKDDVIPIPGTHFGAVGVVM